jgi:hypothetical protein
MAKRRSNRSPESHRPAVDGRLATQSAGDDVSLRGVEETIVDFAEDLGRILGTTQKKASDWMRQRQTVIKQLEGIRATAEGLLGQLGNVTAVVVRRGRKPGRSAQPASDDQLASRPAATNRQRGTASKRKRREMTAAERRAVSERMRKYWAARRKAKQ